MGIIRRETSHVVMVYCPLPFAVLLPVVVLPPSYDVPFRPVAFLVGVMWQTNCSSK